MHGCVCMWICTPVLVIVLLTHNVIFMVWPFQKRLIEEKLDARMVSYYSISQNMLACDLNGSIWNVHFSKLMYQVGSLLPVIKDCDWFYYLDTNTIYMHSCHWIACPAGG